jgi:hypothetical protein
MLPIEFPAGTTTLLSKSAKTANWRETNLMRWDDGVTLRPVLGWEQIVYPTAFASRVRAIHRWMTLAGIFYTAYLCEAHCYIDTGGALFDISPTPAFAPLPNVGAGYGEKNYNLSTYGTPRLGASSLQKFSPAWSINNWGEDLLVMSSYDGRLLMWDSSAPTSTLTPVATAPTNNRQFVVTPDRHCMLFQMGGQQGDFGWCSQENINDWDFASITNTAGKFTVDPFSPIVAAHSSAVGVTVHTPAMTHFVEYVGLPYIYRRRAIGKIPIPISAASMSSIPEGIVWISVEGFWMFNGSTADTIPCPIWDVIAAKMDFERTVRESHSINMLARGEIWWFWVDPTLGLETTRYAAIDYRGKVWMSGYLHRTCGNTYANDRFPVMSDGFKVWKHESGFQYPEALFMPYLESQTISIASGENWNTITKIMPDIAGDKTALTFRLAMQNDRSDYASEKYSTQRTVNEHGWVDIRETARDVRLRIDMVRNSDWSTVGPIIFDIKKRGKKK